MTNKGEEGMHWFRTFYFPKKERHFDADMIIDQKSHKVLDYFGKPRLLMSELHFTVTKHGLHIQSGRQKLLMLGREWPLPSWLYGVSDVVEGYEEHTGEYTIHVHVKNQLFGAFLHIKAGLLKGWCLLMNKWHLISSLLFMCWFIATRLMTGPVAELFVLIAILFFLPAVLFFLRRKSGRESREY